MTVDDVEITLYSFSTSFHLRCKWNTLGEQSINPYEWSTLLKVSFLIKIRPLSLYSNLTVAHIISYQSLVMLTETTERISSHI